MTTLCTRFEGLVCDLIVAFDFSLRLLFPRIVQERLSHLMADSVFLLGTNCVEGGTGTWLMFTVTVNYYLFEDLFRLCSFTGV